MHFTLYIKSTVNLLPLQDPFIDISRPFLWSFCQYQSYLYVFTAKSHIYNQNCDHPSTNPNYVLNNFPKHPHLEKKCKRGDVAIQQTQPAQLPTCSFGIHSFTLMHEPISYSLKLGGKSQASFQATWDVYKLPSLNHFMLIHLIHCTTLTTYASQMTWKCNQHQDYVKDFTES